MSAVAAAGHRQPGGVLGWVLDVIEALGAPGVGLLVALESVFPPIPSEVVLPLAGFLAGQGRMAFGTVVAFATAGSLAGALLLYWLGASLGTARLERLADRIPLMDARDVRRADEWMARHGAWAVLLGRMVPGVRSLVSVPAGVQRMPLARFVLLTTVGSAAWNALFVGLGFVLEEEWDRVGAYSDLVTYAVAGAAALIVGVLAVRRYRRRRAGLDPVSGDPR